MGMNGEYMSLAEACGEAPVSSRGWVPGEDFDPSDPDEMEIMHAVWEQEKHDRMSQLERENARLRRRVNELEGRDEDDEPDYSDIDEYYRAAGDWPSSNVRI